MVIFNKKHNYSFLLEFKYVEIDFDLFQEAITFKTTKSFSIITLLSFIRKVLIPFDFNSPKKISYQFIFSQ